MKRQRKLLGAVCLLAAAFFLAPLTMGILHFGMVWPAVVLAWCAAWLLWPRAMEKLPLWLRWAANVVMALGIALAAVLTALMISAAAQSAGEGDATVIVLGCQVYDGKPSVMLQNRIDAAYDYLTAHPQAPCICTGGMDDREDMTEADCTANTLGSMGIAPERLYREDRSGSTAENLANSAVIIAENGLPDRVVIATDAFHQYRGAWYARQNGLTPSAASCASPWYLAPGYWCREMAAIVAMWLRGY